MSVSTFLLLALLQAMFPQVAASGGGPSATDNSSGPSPVLLGVLVTIFLLSIIITGYFAWTRSRFRLNTQAPTDTYRLGRLRPKLTREAVSSIPIVRYQQQTVVAKSEPVVTLVEEATLPIPPRQEGVPRRLIRLQRLNPFRYIDAVSRKFQGSQRRATYRDGFSSCSICTETFNNGARLRKLPCSHVFHPACIDPWLLERASTCPLCRADLERQLDVNPRRKSWPGSMPTRPAETVTRPPRAQL